MRREPGGAVFWIAMALGAAIVAFGVAEAFATLRPARLVNLTAFLAAATLGHDAVWAPVLVGGAIVTRFVPAPFRRTVRVLLAASAGLVLFAVPLLVSDAHARNPSSLPLAYGRNLAVIVAGMWVVGVAAAVVERARTARRA